MYLQMYSVLNQKCEIQGTMVKTIIVSGIVVLSFREIIHIQLQSRVVGLSAFCVSYITIS